MKSKVKIMNTKPPVSEDEINSFMNFEDLLVKQGTLIRLRKRRVKIVTGTAFLFSVTALIIFLKWHAPPVNEATPLPTKEAMPALIKTDSATHPLEEIKTPEAVKTKQSDEKDYEQKRSKVIISDHETPLMASQNESLQIAYVQAEPVNGYPVLYEYFNRALVYPESSIKDSIQGVVTVVVVIDKEGKPDKIKIENSLGKTFDEEAIRVIKNMPAWIPALHNGKPVASTISVPLTFELKKIKTH